MEKYNIRDPESISSYCRDVIKTIGNVEFLTQQMQARFEKARERFDDVNYGRAKNAFEDIGKKISGMKDEMNDTKKYVDHFVSIIRQYQK